MIVGSVSPITGPSVELLVDSVQSFPRKDAQPETHKTRLCHSERSVKEALTREEDPDQEGRARFIHDYKLRIHPPALNLLLWLGEDHPRRTSLPTDASETSALKAYPTLRPSNVSQNAMLDVPCDAINKGRARPTRYSPLVDIQMGTIEHSWPNSIHTEGP
jgi:hypothetical protein